MKEKLENINERKEPEKTHLSRKITKTKTQVE